MNTEKGTENFLITSKIRTYIHDTSYINSILVY